jgi:hypothetical protein
MFFLRTILPAALISTLSHIVLLLLWGTGGDWTEIKAPVSDRDGWMFPILFLGGTNFCACVVILLPIILGLWAQGRWTLVTAGLAGCVSALPFVGVACLGIWLFTPGLSIDDLPYLAVAAAPQVLGSLAAYAAGGVLRVRSSVFAT